MKKALCLMSILAAGMLVACGGASTPADNSSKNDSKDNSISSIVSSDSSSEEGENYQAKHYELVGTNDELYNMFGAFEAYAVLENGKGTIYDGTVQNSTNVLTYTETSFNYRIAADEDGIVTMTYSIGGARGTSYMSSDGSFEITFTHVIGGGYTRPVTVKGKAEVLYENVDAWKAAIDAKYASRTVEATVNKTYTGIVTKVGEEEQFKAKLGGYEVGLSAAIEFMSDFTVKAKYGVEAGGKFNQVGEKEGTWTVVDSQEIYTIDGAEYRPTKDGKTQTFTWKFTYGEGDSAVALQAVVSYTEA